MPFPCYTVIKVRLAPIYSFQATRQLFMFVSQIMLRRIDSENILAGRKAIAEENDVKERRSKCRIADI
jgi:hypothetical protein